MNYENIVFVIQDIHINEIILVTKSKERAIEYLPTHRVSAIEVEQLLEPTNRFDAS